MLFNTAFRIKEHFQIFEQNGTKTLENQEMSFIFCQTCLHVD